MTTSPLPAPAPSATAAAAAIVALSIFTITTTTIQAASSPHIILIIADDLGWSDVGWMDPDMVTPNLNTLKDEGVDLTSAYMQALCSPSRAAVLSGKYPFKMGMQHATLKAVNNGTMPLGLKLLPERLKDLGYSTHLVGKWHLGFCSWDMTPTFRGFDTFYGMYLGQGDHYTHLGKRRGYDMQDNEAVDWTADGIYSTHLFTDKAIEVLKSHDPAADPLFLMVTYQAIHSPMEVPAAYLDMCAGVSDVDRQIVCGMTAAMDEGIGNITAELTNLGYYDGEVLLFFTTDNGGAPTLGSSNWPLRGGKSTVWEGGTRAVSFLHSQSLLPNAPYTWDGLIHAVDWFPTLLGAIGDDTGLTDIDGMNLWKSIRDNTDSLRNEMVYNIDEVSDNAAIRQGNYKLVYNRPGKPDGWYNPPAGETAPDDPTGPYPTYELFDLDTDPYEMTDVMDKNDTTGSVGATLISRLNELKLELVPADDGVGFASALPTNFDGAWYPGWC